MTTYSADHPGAVDGAPVLPLAGVRCRLSGQVHGAPRHDEYNLTNAAALPDNNPLNPSYRRFIAMG